MQDLFFNNASSVQSERILYTPSAFARGSLLHLQEVGSLKAVHPHTSMRTDLVSCVGGRGECNIRRTSV